MKYLRFHPDVPHDETCEFEFFSKGIVAQFCGKPAIGRRGAVPLCAEHFGYARAADVVSKLYVENETPPANFISKRLREGGSW